MRVAKLAGFGVAGLVGLSLASFPAAGLAQDEGGAKPAVSAGKKWEAEFSRWQTVSSGADVAAYEAYLKDYPNGTFASMARIRIAELKAAQAKAGPSSETAADAKSPAAETTAESRTGDDEPASGAARTAETGRDRGGRGLDVAVSPEAAAAQAKKAEADKAARDAAEKADAELKAEAAAKAQAEEKARLQAETERKQAEEQAAAEKARLEAAKADAEAKAEQERLAADAAAKAEAERAAADAARAEAQAAEAERVRAQEAAEAERRRAEETAEAERLKAEEAAAADRARQAEQAEAERAREADEAAAAAQRTRDAEQAEAESARLKADAAAESKREADAFEAAVLDGSVAAFEGYMDAFPKGRFVGEAKQRIAAIGEGATPAEPEGGNADVATVDPDDTPVIEERTVETPVIDRREAYLNPRQRANAQRWLTALGFRTFGIDGVFGPRTRQAIAGWQQSNGFSADGYLTRKQFRALNEAGRFAARRYNNTIVRRQPRYDDGYGYYEGPVEDYYGGGYYYDGDVIISGPGY